jgi:hypothetical protein
MKTYDIGGAAGPLACSCVIIDIMDHLQFKKLWHDNTDLSEEPEYIQADISEPLPTHLHLSPGNVNAGYVLMYVVDPTGYLELEPPTNIDIHKLNVAADNIALLTAPGGRITITDAPAIVIPVVARLGSNGLKVLSVSLIEYPDEDRPSIYEVILERLAE